MLYSFSVWLSCFALGIGLLLIGTYLAYMGANLLLGSIVSGPPIA